MLDQYEKVKLILLEEFVASQARNPNYSMRSYAKKIGISQAAISQILSGKRPITRKSAEKILQGLDRSPMEISQIFNAELGKKALYKSIDMDVYRLISDWYYYAILSLTETNDFESDPAKIAIRLNISEKQAREAIDLLVRLKLLERDPISKKLKATGEQFEAMSPVANPALKKACRQNLQLAQSALEETHFDERDFTAITLCFDPSQMTLAKRLIKNFRRSFCKAMEAQPKKEVYKLSVQLFPLSQRGRK